MHSRIGSITSKVLVSESTLNPVNGSAPVYGDSTQKSDLGNMHVNSTDGAIWIYS